MKIIQLTQGQVALVDDIDYDFLMRWKWCANLVGRHYRPVRGFWLNGKQKSIFIYTAIAKRMGIDTERIDHKDQNTLNNQRSNLRSATNSQNGHNCGPRSNSKTGVKGVSFHKASGKYQTQITVCGKDHYLGLFDTIAEAEEVVVAKRRELVGEFAAA